MNDHRAWSKSPDRRPQIEQKKLGCRTIVITSNDLVQQWHMMQCAFSSRSQCRRRVAGCIRNLQKYSMSVAVQICGIGKVTEKTLAALNINTCSDLYHHRDILYLLHSQLSFEYFMRISLGIGSHHATRSAVIVVLLQQTTHGCC